MLKKRMIYLLLFSFFIWLALATRKHPQWFPALVVEYGGDVFWATACLFFLRMLFPVTNIVKLAACNFILGALIEASQLYHGEWANAVRRTYLGRLLFGLGFLWSDIICYAVGTVIGWMMAVLVERYFIQKYMRLI